MKEVQRVLQALLVEYRCAVNDWEKFVRIVQWALNSSHRQRLGCFPFKAFWGGEPTSMLAYLTQDHAEVVDAVQIPDKDIKLMIADVTTATYAMHEHVLEATQQMREASTRRASKGALPDLVLVAKVRQAGKASKR